MLSFFSTTPPPPPFYTLSLHDALPISLQIFVHFAAVHFYYFRQLTQARFALQLLNRRVARARTLPRPTRGETRQDERRHRAPTLRLLQERGGVKRFMLGRARKIFYLEIGR